MTAPVKAAADKIIHRWPVTDLINGSGGNDIIDGGEGSDTVGYSYSSIGAVNANLTTGIVIKGTDK